MNEQAELPATTRIAAYAIAIDDQHRILLARVAAGYVDVGQWTLPGGGLNFGEDPATGALRELEEETGLVGEIGSVAFVGSWTRGPLPEHGLGAFYSVQIVYHVRITGGTIRHETDNSTDMAAWIPLREISTTPIVPLVRETLEYLETTGIAIEH